MRTVYISGPMAGYPNMNEPAFRAAEGTIREGNDEPLTPHDLLPHSHTGACPKVYGDGRPGDHDGGCYLRGDLAAMLDNPGRRATMSRRTETCVVWTCDDCNEEYGEDDGTIHLTADESPTGWETIDGKDVCDECFQCRECAEKGHEWGEWIRRDHWPLASMVAVDDYRPCIRCFDAVETRTRPGGAS